MSSTSTNVEENLAKKLQALIEDAENFYESKVSDENCKMKTLTFFTQDEIDDLCTKSVALYHFNRNKEFYFKKIAHAEENIKSQRERLDYLQKKVDALNTKKQSLIQQEKESSENDKKSITEELKDIAIQLDYYSDRIKKCHMKIEFYQKEITENGIILKNGESSTAEYEDITQKLKDKAKIKIRG